MRDVPDLCVLLVGDGPLRAELTARAQALAAPVRFVGSQPQTRVQALLGSADAVIVLQGGGVITEAALCGAPVATYDFELNPHVVRPQRHEGVVVPFRDVAALAAAVRGLLADPAGARATGRRLRTAARERFSVAAARAAEQRAAAALMARRTLSSGSGSGHVEPAAPQGLTQED
jgi:glycosyltransferase involved in cell wall biosynthesis